MMQDIIAKAMVRSVRTDVAQLLQENRTFQERLKDVSEVHFSLQQRLTSAESRLEDHERDKRMNNIIIGVLSERTYGELDSADRRISGPVAGP